MDVTFDGLLTFKEIEKYKMPFKNIPKKYFSKAIKNSKKTGIPVKFEPNETCTRSINKCQAWLEPYIMRDGYVMPCCAVMMSNKRDWLRKHALGNVNKQHFRKIWHGKKYMALKKIINNPRAPVPSICLACRTFDTTKRSKKYGVKDISKIK